MKIKYVIKTFVAALLLATASQSYAVLLDFEELAGISIAGGDLAPVTVIDDEYLSDGVLFGMAGVSAGIGVFDDVGLATSGSKSVGGLNAAGIFPGSFPGCCSGDIYFSFVGGVANQVNFTLGDSGGDLDSFTVMAYDSADMLIDTQMLSNVSNFAVSIIAAGIARVVIDFDDANIFGYSMDELEFELDRVAVPEPYTLGLFGLGLLLVGMRRKMIR